MAAPSAPPTRPVYSFKNHATTDERDHAAGCVYIMNGFTDADREPYLRFPVAATLQWAYLRSGRGISLPAAALLDRMVGSALIMVAREAGAARATRYIMTDEPPHLQPLRLLQIQHELEDEVAMTSSLFDRVNLTAYRAFGLDTMARRRLVVVRSLASRGLEFLADNAWWRRRIAVVAVWA